MGSVIPIINLRNNPIRQLGVFLIQSKLLIAYAALVLTLVIPAQVGLKLVLNPYLVMVFLATYLVYNLTRLVLLQFYKMPLEHSNDQWVNRYIGRVGANRFFNSYSLHFISYSSTFNCGVVCIAFFKNKKFQFKTNSVS